MGWGRRSLIPATLLLLLLHSGHAADSETGETCTIFGAYEMCVEKTVEATDGCSATLPCRFRFPSSEKPSRISVIWRIGNFLGASIFDNTDDETFVQELFTDRLTLVGNPDERDASLQIRSVRRSDQDKYYCRIMLHTESRTIPFETQDGTSLVIGENVAEEACTNSQGYEVCVSRTVEAVEGGSVTLPCRFAFLKSEKPSNISVMWRIGNFIGVSIFDNTNNQTIVHELFRNRLRLVGDLHKHKASLQITDVRRSDQNTYYCRIIFHTESHDAPFEITKGTHLMIQDAGAGEDCINNHGYEMCIEKTVEAMVGSSASLPCRFAFLKSEKPSKVSVIWRIGNYLGYSIFDNSDNQTFVHKLFADRLTLMGNPDKHEASLQISGVRHSDQDTYYCRIILHMKSGDIKYQTFTGTRLVIQDAAVGEVCSNSQGYQLCVTKAVVAMEGGSANLICRFAFPESKKPSSISVIWRIGNFLGHSIFENTDNRTFVHELFTNRLTLMGNPDKGEASIQIREVRRSDQNMYYCRIMLYTESQEMPFEITKGTNLIIQDAGIGEICSSSNSYEVCVERAVEAVEGGSTTLPCRFAFPESEKPSSISVIWRIGTFFRDSIFERTDNQTHVHELFTNRLTLMGNPDKGEASLQINGVRHSDQNTYSCRIILHMESRKIPFEVLEGTNLVIQDAGLPSEEPSQCVHTLALALLTTITLLFICANFIIAIVFVRGFGTRDTLDEAPVDSAP